MQKNVLEDSIFMDQLSGTIFKYAKLKISEVIGPGLVKISNLVGAGFFASSLSFHVWCYKVINKNKCIRLFSFSCAHDSLSTKPSNFEKFSKCRPRVIFRDLAKKMFAQKGWFIWILMTKMYCQICRFIYHLLTERYSNRS